MTDGRRTQSCPLFGGALFFIMGNDSVIFLWYKSFPDRIFYVTEKYFGQKRAATGKPACGLPFCVRETEQRNEKRQTTAFALLYQ